MNELILVLPPFITAFLFVYIAFKFNLENNKNVAFQFLFFVLALGFVVMGFAQQHEITDVNNNNEITTHYKDQLNNTLALTSMSYLTTVVMVMVSIALLLVFMIYSFFNMAREESTKGWDRVQHKER